MRVLVNTNVLVRAAMPTDPQYAEALNSLLTLGRLGHVPSVVPQVVYEYWVVATRPKEQNGLAISVAEATRDIDDICRDYLFLEDAPEIFASRRQLVAAYNVLGKKAHDARLVAAMLRHGVTHLLTFNEQDFARFAEITVISPESATLFPPASA